MKFAQRHFTISPAVVPVGKKVTITIKGHNEQQRFFDDVAYTVKIAPREHRDYFINDDLNVRSIEHNTVKPKVKDGVLYFDYIFEKEQEWSVSVKVEDKEQYAANTKWMHPIFGDCWKFHRLENFHPEFLRVYSLEEDLYGLKAYKGDTHTHTEYSDGNDSPEQFCSHYRGFGYDFVAITDHFEYPASLRAIDKMSELKTNFTVFPGEEVHVKQSGRFHTVNFNGKSSVNTKIFNNYDEVKAD